MGVSWRNICLTGMLVCFLSACTNSQPENEFVEAITTEAETTIAETPPRTEAAEMTTEAPTQTEIETTTEPMTEAEPIDYASLKVNEQGHIMVVMYHGIMDNPPYHRLKEDFIKDMTYMYEHGYRLISVKDYMSGHINIEAGMTPILFTFDDGLESTFSLIEKDEAYEVNPETAIGMLESFAIDHPDFGTAASLYIHANDYNFKDVGTAEDRLKWLVDHGYELGNHSDTHANFKKLGKESLIKEIGAVEVYVDSVLPGYKLTAMTYPFGARPATELLPVLNGGIYQGFEFDYDVAFREGPSAQFYPPNHVKFDYLNAPRVRGSEGDIQDLWWFLDYYEENPSLKYISDGDPMTLVVPAGKEGNLREGISDAFEVITY